MRPSISPILAIVLVLALGGCASLGKSGRLAVLGLKARPPKLAVRAGPLPDGGLTAAARVDRYYQDARSAIERRDYSIALQLLQAARDAKADDVRVLNGFGVVYDKLGRFDLSARYYAQAQALDPASTVVANNIAYSAWLRGSPSLSVSAPAMAGISQPQPALMNPLHPSAAQQVVSASPTSRSADLPSDSRVSQLAAADPPPSGGRVIYESPGVVRLVLPSASAPPTGTLAAGRTSRPVVLVNASGLSDGVLPVRLQLVSLGWTAPEVASGPAPAQARSSIQYPARDEVTARALARTLPMRPTLVVCADGCQDIRLYVGRDAVGLPADRPARRRS